MTEVDLINDILSSNPNEPAPKGALLLLRTEMKSEFRDVRTQFNEVHQQLGLINRSLDLIAQQVAVLVGRQN